MLATVERFLREGGPPLVVVLAGPNGTGKSTFYTHYLAASGLPFINADRLALDVARHDPASVGYAAAELANRHRQEMLARGESFIFETVFSDPAGDKLSFLRQAQAQGYSVFLVFIGLDSPMLSMARVAQRVDRGGHDVPDEKLQARFPRTLENLKQAVSFVDLAVLFDNSRIDEPFRFVAAYEHGQVVESTPLRPRWAGQMPGLEE